VDKNNPYMDAANQAKQIFSKVNNDPMHFGVTPTGEVEQLRREYIERAQRRIDIYRENEQEYLENMMHEIDEQRTEKLLRIQKAFNKDSDSWINDIFQSIITAD